MAKRLAVALRGTEGVDVLLAAVSELLDYAESDWRADVTVIEAESEAVTVSRRVVHRLFERKLQRRLDDLDAESARRPGRCPECEAPTTSRGRKERGWMSSLGPLRLQRRCLACTGCGSQCVPSQRDIGLGDSEFTPRFEEVCTLMSSTVPFDMARGLLEEMCGITASTKGVETMTERRGAALLDVLAREAEDHCPFDSKGLPREGVPRPEGARLGSDAPRRAYVEIDGVIPMTRVEIEPSQLSEIDRARIERARANKVRGGKGRRFNVVGREVKNAVLYTDDDCVKPDIGRGSLLDKRYVSHLGEWKAFAKSLWVEMRRQRFDDATELILISDGAEWIRSLADWLPISCTLILDLFHVKHRIWEAAHALFGQTSKASAWAKRQCARVENGRAKGVIRTLESLTPNGSEAREVVRLLAHYLESNLDRMD
ncbi:MAG: UPF0236 family protein [Polyangiaceae bacterium]|nr:UPF0236 family protein [Polyangiaceae bacterium]